MPTEADTCRTYVLPALQAAGWTNDQIGEQRIFTDGRIIVEGTTARRGKRKRADYLLLFKPSYPLAVIEAKAEYKSAGDGMQQAKSYATTLGLLFAYATNGLSILEYDFTTGMERAVETFPSPAELWARYRKAQGLEAAPEDKLLVGDFPSDQLPRYYQRIAINRAVEAILKGRPRVLLTLATGTGKTVIAFQIAWRLWQGHWNRKGIPNQQPRILFLADRTVLVDDPKDKTFAPFGDARHKIGGGIANKARQVYFSTYQALVGDVERPPLYRQYAPDFFDLIIVDEAHRGSARDDSSWREILEYFTGAAQLGMTATPLREDNRDTYHYFGDPIYTYSLRQGIQDGFLAPYEVRRVVIDVDAEGWRPYAGQVDDLGREIPDREYMTRDFERVISLPARTQAVAEHLTRYLKATDRFAKTLVFCVDQEHADQMRRALANANADLMRQYPNYVARVTGDEGDLGKALLSTFQDVESQTPVILTTSQMLTTGVDAPMVRNVALVKVINSMTDFKQIIGRGTRVREDYNKLFFTILDYTGAATQNFADPAFDGEPVKVVVEQTDQQGAVESAEELPTPAQDEEGDADTAATDEIAETAAAYGPGVLVQPKERQQPRKFYLSDGLRVEVIHETVQELDADGRKLRTLRFTDYTGEQVRSLYRSAAELAGRWALADERERIIDALEARGVTVAHLAEVMGQPEADPFDLLCALAFRTPVLTRRERANRLRAEKRDFLARYAPEARAILDRLLEQYASYGVEELRLPGALRLPTIAGRRTVSEIAALFGGPERLRAAVSELQALLYAA
ncbi:MAG TPA: DEAD/DEAH box helicase family protein [Ktedonobacterales bacterium]